MKLSWSNARRANRFAAALEHYLDRNEGLEVTDFFADMLHYLDSRRQTLDQVMKVPLAHHQSERASNS